MTFYRERDVHVHVLDVLVLTSTESLHLYAASSSYTGLVSSQRVLLTLDSGVSSRYIQTLIPSGYLVVAIRQTL